jgi:hypothetical protein
MDAARKETLEKAYGVIAEIYGILAHAFYMFGFLLISGLPKNKYAWMAEEDPTMSIPQDPSASDTVLHVTFILIAITIVQLVIVVMGKRMWVRAVSGALIVLALVVWTIRFIV